MSHVQRLAFLAAVCAVAGCGGHQASSEDPVLAPSRPTGNGLTPALPRHPLVEIQRIGDQAGTSDKIVFGRNGRAVIIRAYGGGGFYSYRCALTGAERAAVRAAVERLPLGKAPKHKPQKRDSYYQTYPPRFILRSGHYSGSFTADAVPRDGRWFVRHVRLMVTGHEGRCRETFGQRSR
jgi:hypothetical protein